ncbi:MAG: hypothetical protein FJ253_03630 [Phycisphaerae bacterium]|nr:hypothetical protein [Phycisphaerae bacterium]
MPKSSNSLQRQLESMVKELSELRALKVAHDQLSGAYENLTKLVARATGFSLGRPRGPGRPKGSGAVRRSRGGKRYRSSAAEVQKAYAALASKAGKDWITKEQLCKAAGVKPASVAAAWKRLMEGYKGSDGKMVKPVLESNGSRGLKGRYRKR